MAGEGGFEPDGVVRVDGSSRAILKINVTPKSSLWMGLLSRGDYFEKRLC